MSRLIPIFLLITLLAEASIGAVLTPVSYWKKALPNTSMPDALESFLPTAGSGPRYGGKWVRTSQAWDRNNIILIRQVYQKFAKLVSRPRGSFFLEGALKPGTAMDIRFLAANINSDQKMPTFFPRHLTDVLPFSTSSLATILQRFSLSPASPEASTMKDTLELCEMLADEGETRLCTTSLESMVDFATSQLGTNNLHAFSTSFHKTRQQLDLSYVVLPGIVKVNSPVAVVCHHMPYAYAVFYCHKTMDTRSYAVPLMAAKDGSRVDAAVVCHANTSHWGPEHPSFKMLGVRPGTVPICHFISHNNFLWVSK